MSHVCGLCGALCYCDLEDHESEQPDDCLHICSEDDDDDELVPDEPPTRRDSQPEVK
jgi:hypothetical protein